MDIRWGRDEEPWVTATNVEHLFVRQTLRLPAHRTRAPQVYNLAKERKRQLEQIHEDGYHMPDSYDAPDKHHSRFDVAKQRYQEAEDPEKANPFAEQEKWEAEQMRRTHMKVCVGEWGG